MNIPHIRRSRVGALLLAAFMFFAPFYSRAQSPVEATRKVVTRTPVLYPNIARSMNLHGSVRVEAQVAANGTVKAVEVRGGHPILAESAISAVRQWKFEPASHETREVIEVKFDPQGM